MCGVGQNHTYTPYMAVYLVISLPKIRCLNRIYIYIYIYGSGQPFSCALSRLVVYTVLSSPCCEYYACFFCYLTGKQTPLKCPMRHSDEQKQIDNQAKTNWSLLPLHLVFCCCKGPLKRPASCSQLLQLERHNFAQTAEFSV